MAAPLNAARKELAALQALPGAPSSPALDVLVRRPRVGVGCILSCPAHPGALLVGARRGSHGAGRWALPGGHLEFGLAFADTASAELEEECGLALAPARWAHCHTSNNVMAAEDLHYITLFLHAEVTREEAAAVRNVEAHKCEGWEWVPAVELRGSGSGSGGRPLFLPLQHLLAWPALDALLAGAQERPRE
jgi:8-oxo-dGTP diphosphatase